MRKQRGVTAIGWIFLLIPVVLVLYALLRIGPVYYGHYKLVQAMKGTANNLKSDETLTPQTIRSALELRFDTDYVDVLTPKELEIAKSGEGGWTMTADYEKAIEYFGNLHLLLVFNEVVDIH
jgi:hypothetical protein